MPPFAQASYLSQIKRLRQIAELALRRYPVKDPTVHFINHGENTTFRIEGKGGKKFLLRIHRENYHTAEALGEELRWLHQLGAEKAVYVPRPVQSKQGNYLEQVESPGVPSPRNCDLLEWVEGKFIFKSATPKHLFHLGQLMAQLHHSTRKTKVIHRKYWDAQGLVGAKPKFGAIGKIPGLPKAKQSLLQESRKEIFSYLQKFERRFPQRQGLIHADLHFGNFLVGKDGLGAIDFDDCGLGFHAYDLAIPLTHLSYLCEKNPQKKFRSFVDGLQNGYASLGSWDQHDEALLPYLFAARTLVMVGWLQSRSDNPKLQKRLLINAKRAVKLLQTDWRHFQ